MKVSFPISHTDVFGHHMVVLQTWLSFFVAVDGMLGGPGTSGDVPQEAGQQASVNKKPDRDKLAYFLPLRKKKCSFGAFCDLQRMRLFITSVVL